MKRPSNIQKFKPVDPKLGIKSSLPKSKSTIALTVKRVGTSRKW